MWDTLDSDFTSQLIQCSTLLFRMPARYKSKSEHLRAVIDENDVYKALVKVVDGNVGVHQAAAQYNLKSTLSVRLIKLKKEYKVEQVTLKILDEYFEKGRARSKYKCR